MKRQRSAAAAVTAVDPRKAKVDELGALEAELAKVKDKQAKVKGLKAEIAAWAKDLAAEKDTLYEGYLYAAAVSAQEQETAITDMQAVFDALGRKKFLELCNLTLKAARENLPADVQAVVLKTERSGSRTVKAMKRAA